MIYTGGTWNGGSMTFDYEIELGYTYYLSFDYMGHDWAKLQAPSASTVAATTTKVDSKIETAVWLGAPSSKTSWTHLFVKLTAEDLLASGGKYLCIHWCQVDPASNFKNISIVKVKPEEEYLQAMKDKTAESVIKALDGIERQYGSELFKKVFKTITIDNGSEFSNFDGIERSINGTQRTHAYYCHPYSSYERGSNENQNKLVRRHYPKGVSFERVTAADIRKLEKWVNNYPRGIFNYHCSAELFEACLTSIAA